MRPSPSAARATGLCGAAAAWLLVACVASADDLPAERFDTVVVDAGHGGGDEGARGPRGAREKDVVLAIANALAAELRQRGLRVVLTRPADAFVPLEQRTHIANDARADLFVSIHANAARDARIRGTETFFLSLDATDDAARRLAERENQALGATLPDAVSDPVVAILGELIATEHLQESQEFARMAQGRLAHIDATGSRGVKQAPFVVLAGVQMPACLVEVGFITNPEDESGLRRAARRSSIVSALAEAVEEFGRRYDARRGVGSMPARGAR